MGDYAKTAAMDTFVAARNQRHLTELAMLKGARLVTASETEQNQRWSESRINQLTGNDPITARVIVAVAACPDVSRSGSPQGVPRLVGIANRPVAQTWSPGTLERDARPYR